MNAGFAGSLTLGVRDCSTLFGNTPAPVFTLSDTDGNNVTRYRIYDSTDAPVIGDVMYIDPEADNGADSKSVYLTVTVQGINYGVDIILDEPAPGRSYLVTLVFTNKEVQPSISLTPWNTYTNDADPPVIIH